VGIGNIGDSNTRPIVEGAPVETQIRPGAVGAWHPNARSVLDTPPIPRVPQDTEQRQRPGSSFVPIQTVPLPSVTSRVPPAGLPVAQPSIGAVPPLQQVPPASAENAPVTGSASEAQPASHAAPVGDEAARMCYVCRRVSTPTIPFDLKPADHSNARQFGRTNGLTAESLVCDLCYDYVSPANQPSWAFAWSAVIYTCLSRRHYVDEPLLCLELVPQTLRESWAHAVNEFIPEIRAAWANHPCSFVDITCDLKRFEDCIAQYRITELDDMMNEFPIGTVRCPMGCYVYIEQAVLLSGAHYLASIVRNFRSFGADSSYFWGSRSDWPRLQVLELLWWVRPSLYIDPEKGLCVMTCPVETHADGRHRYAHVPQNPVFPGRSLPYQDEGAPIVQACHLFVLQRKTATTVAMQC